MCFPYFLFSLVLFFLSYFLGLCCSPCLSLWSKRRTNKGKRATTKGRNKEGQEKGRDRNPPPPKTKEEFWKGFLFCFCSAVYLKHPPPKGQKHRQHKVFVGSFSFSQKNQAPYKNKSKQKNKSGGNLVIYHLGGISLLVCFPFLFFLWFIFFIFFVFSLFLLFFFFCVVFPLLFLLVILLSVSFLFGAKEGK